MCVYIYIYIYIHITNNNNDNNNNNNDNNNDNNDNNNDNNNNSDHSDGRSTWIKSATNSREQQKTELVVLVVLAFVCMCVYVKNNRALTPRRKQQRTKKGYFVWSKS